MRVGGRGDRGGDRHPAYRPRAGGDAVKLAANRAHGHLVAQGVGDPGGVGRDGLQGANARTPLALAGFHVHRRGRVLLHRDVGGGLVALEERVPVGGRTRGGRDARPSAGAGGGQRVARGGRESGGKRTSRGSGTIDPIRRAQVGRTRDSADQLAELHALSGGRDAASQRSVLAGGQGAAMGQGDETTSAPERGRNNNNRGWARGRELARGRGGAPGDAGKGGGNAHPPTPVARDAMVEGKCDPASGGLTPR